MPEQRLFLTGDTHGDFSRFNTTNFPIQKELTKDDVVIILGDFGGIWDYRGTNNSEEYWLDWLEDKKFTTCFIDGNHENFTRLYSYPIEKWCGGNTHVIRPHVRHLMRGEVFTFNDKTFLAMGGNSSHDIKDGILDPESPTFEEDYKRLRRKPGALFRIDGRSWWREEIPSFEEGQNCQMKVAAHDYQVNYVLAHSAPQSVISAMGYREPNKMGIFWENLILEDFKFDKFFAGHYHIDATCWGAYRFMYTDIIELY